MFLILREPADLLATAVITYRNEDETDSKRLTGEPRTLDHTSMQGVCTGDCRHMG